MLFLKDTLSIEDAKSVQGMHICLFVSARTITGRYPHQKCENFNTLSQFFSLTNAGISVISCIYVLDHK